ncbi:serine protease FAM111A-like [Salminus brasiliensis]|uniref:serine protease FAM111A-like n=1 Tax=Salminus brasiliensis TaxID=930266 RepID=UPI003B8315CE
MADIRDFFTPRKQNQSMDEEEQDQGKEDKKPTNEKHYFKFRHTYGKHVVTCDASMTVLEALHSNSVFRGIRKKIQNVHKDLVIRREKAPRPAVNTDFPCCLIDQGELLDITFIKSGGNGSSKGKSPITWRSLTSSPENFCVFNVKTTGGEKIKWLMKNLALKKEVEDVCVYALRGEEVRTALKRDGRFRPVIFRKHCALFELEAETNTNMSNTVDHLNAKECRVIIIDDGPPSQEFSQEFSQESDTVKKEESGEASASSPQPQSANSEGQDSADAQQQKPPPPTASGKQSREYPKKIYVKEVPNTGEILKLLRDQFGALLEQLKAREGLTKPAEVQKFFREEYDKSVQSFSEVKRVKRLMELSDSVCQIRLGGDAIGTGFLLFDRFILTNAHVVGGFDPFTHRLHRPITAVFDYEDLNMGNKLSVKENLVAIYYGKDEKGRNLDFALLELADDAVRPKCLDLLSNYSPPPIRGGICIVGHPESGVKKMDPCFIIEKEEVPKALNRHCDENRNYFHVITQQCFAEKWEYNFSQISYDSCFFHGSSGSPVFNDHCQLIGVHTGGYAYKQGKKTRSVEYALPMLPILVRIVRQCRLKDRADVLKYFEAQGNMKHVLQLENQGNPQDGY